MILKTTRLYNRYLKFLSPFDTVGVLFLLLLSIINIVHSNKIGYWLVLVCVNLISMLLIVFIVRRYESKSANKKDGFNKRFSILRVVRFWYAIALILLCFKEVYMIIHLSHSPDYDLALIRIDMYLFGVNPTQWIHRFANPLLTEFLQIIYFLYYVVIITYGLELYLWKRFEELKYATFIILSGFFLSYIIYMIFPAAGPRFYLHDFKAIDKELPGLIFTGWIREILNFGESIPANVPNPQDFVQRDAMPSAHAAIAFLLAYLSFKIRSRSFYFYLPYCILMILSTIYLRYHYVVDIVAGLILAVVTVAVCNIIYKKKMTVTEQT